MCLEQPSDAVEHVAKQVSVAASELAFYNFTSRAAKRHCSKLRDLSACFRSPVLSSFVP
jgi:hypothetical protein